MTKEVHRQVIGKFSSKYMKHRKKTGLFAFYELPLKIQKQKMTKARTIILSDLKKTKKLKNVI
jgi:hypothetical protein